MRINRTLPAGTAIDLIRSLFTTFVPTVIMSFAFLGVAVLVLSRTPDRQLAVLTVTGAIASVMRAAVILLNRREATGEKIGLARALRLERRFTAAYLTFAVTFGAFAARAFVVGDPETHMLVVGLLVGYGAGAAAGIALRPRIAVPAMLLAIVPTIIVALATPRSTYVAMGLLLAVLLGGGIQSVLRRYRNVASNVTLRRTYTGLARSDALTGLANRLSLREAFEAAAGMRGKSEILVVYCLDLDRFKPVNDTYGHPIGDGLLRAVSQRLGGLLRRGDLAARMGGDEFVILQTGAQHAGEAEMLARRIVRAIAQPFSIDGHVIQIGTSVGYAICPDHGAELERLIACADEALYQVKRRGGGVAAYGETAPPPAEANRRSA